MLAYLLNQTQKYTSTLLIAKCRLMMLLAVHVNAFLGKRQPTSMLSPCSVHATIRLMSPKLRELYRIAMLLVHHQLSVLLRSQERLRLHVLALQCPIMARKFSQETAPAIAQLLSECSNHLNIVTSAKCQQFRRLMHVL